MGEKLYVVITGANKGIGNALLKKYLLRPHTVVIAAVRDPEAAALGFKDISLSESASLIVVKIDNVSQTNAQSAVTDLRTMYNISKVHIVIANAGMGVAYDSASQTPLESLKEHFDVNTGGPLILFQAFRPLLRAARDSNPKFVLLSSAIASLTQTSHFPLNSTAYGASKAAANFIVQRIHAEEEWLTAFPISPGWVQTDMGNSAATAIGVSEAPMTVEQSVNGMIRLIDTATRLTTSGRFWDFKAEEIPW